MKIISTIRNIFRRKRGRADNTLYYDNYQMLGSILGSYCSMWKSDSRKR